jgi:hypothetical protein
LRPRTASAGRGRATAVAPAPSQVERSTSACPGGAASIRRAARSVGNPAGVLLSRALEADLLVVGARGHGDFEGLQVGSVTEQCVRHARSVVVARPPREGTVGTLA